MAKKFADLIAHRALESQARVEALHQKLRAQMLCRELRQAQALSKDKGLKRECRELGYNV
jgi:hypothetical protein